MIELLKINPKGLLLDKERKKKIKTFDTDYFVGGNYFEGGDRVQNTLVFQVKKEFFWTQWFRCYAVLHSEAKSYF